MDSLVRKERPMLDALDLQAHAYDDSRSTSCSDERDATLETSGAVLFERAKKSVQADTFARELVALRPELHARALRLTRNVALADDLVQDSIERALRFRAQFQPGTNLRSWAQTIVFSLFITGYRRRRRERDAVRVLTVDPCAWTAQESFGIEATTLDLSPSLRRAVESLPTSFRDVLMMVDVGEYSYRDAADALRVPIGTVMSRLHRARKQLAGALEHVEVEKLAA